jgi:hypothetical protein
MHQHIKNMTIEENAAIAYLQERGGSIFINEVPEKTVPGVSSIIAGHEIYRILCAKGIARINTTRDRGDAVFGDTFEITTNGLEKLKTGQPSA